MSDTLIAETPEHRLADFIGEGLRTRTTVRETVVEYARYRRLVHEFGEISLKAGTLLAEYAGFVGAPARTLGDEIPARVHQLYLEVYGEHLPYNWTGAIANPQDLTSTPAGP